ncbi:hypothetical protein P2G88_01070 [Aliiglaciecola sp. CAU 1673]|uniref:RHS repeat domain-containing protein n=1 Tax=Aliiglaciecola sp. CAU 1673 TaxID=3032595 RepID=UPI0023DBFC30|nr:RHS repeat-associated core domain-containing protein [Aliiglaciecola sp. CAU 1673]MDF2176841.1 hypothetical protein [Aliiglaciecola sp. CAU 1673]
MIHFKLMKTALVAQALALALAVVSWSAQAAQSAADYTEAKRYNLAGQVTGVISPDPDGQGVLTHLATRNTYNARGLLTLVESGYLTTWQDESIKPKNWSGFVVRSRQAFTYDAQGRKSTVASQNAYGDSQALTHYSYDAHGRVRCKTVRMNPAAYAALPASACDLGTEDVYGSDRITRYTYNGFDLVLTEERAVGTGIAQTYRDNTYDGARLTHTKDANGNLTHYKYNNYGLLEYLHFPSKEVAGAGTYSSSDFEKYGYDLNGNRTSLRKRDGSVITYVYDNLNQQIVKDIPGSTDKDVYYDYDLRGLQLHARFGADSGQGVVYKFDDFGRLDSVTDNSFGVSRKLSYQHDKNGNREKITFPDNQAFDYGYDQLDRLSGIRKGTTQLVSQKYYEDGALESLARQGESNNTAYQYDEIGRLQGLSQNINLAKVDFTFTYNPASQVATKEISNSLYTYKGNENITGTYIPNGLNQYTEINGQAVTHDDNGNMLTYAGLTYGYDVENRLVSVTGPTAATLKYDPLGRLAQLIAGGKTISFLYDGDALVGEYNGTTMLKRYLHGAGIDDPLIEYAGSSVTNSALRYLHADYQQSIVAATLSNGTMDAINTYDAYGIPSILNQGRFGYTGQLWLDDIGLYYYKARIYHPKLGRFLQTDPVGYVADTNMYAYVGNDPMNYTDPSGEIPLVVVAIWILKEVGGEVFEQTTGIPAPTAKNIAKYGLKKAMRFSIKDRTKISGTYRFKEGNQDYVGQSEDVMKRLQQHASKNKFKEGKAGTLSTNKVDGNKRDREIAEQSEIDTITNGVGAKSDLVSNKINPVKRSDNGMSGVVWKVCSGMGAQKGGCN